MRPPDQRRSLPTKRGWTGAFIRAGLGLLLVGCSARETPDQNFLFIPPGTLTLGSRETLENHPPRRFESDGFRLARRPVTVREWAAYLNATGRAATASYPDLVHRQGRWRATFLRGEYPARGMTRAEAGDYCQWFSERHGVVARLPLADEWEFAARGGIEGARYPWGWGNPQNRARFNASGPARTGRYPANPYGLLDMAGNVFQWCEDFGDPETARACGGAWSEPTERRLRVFERTSFPGNYRGEDVGFRVYISNAMPDRPLIRPGPATENRNLHSQDPSAR
ncbi:MAG: SUMF1/EgtB/PvdO family nonheme iron enzyme [Kiritimatiellia bacterium]|nr:SUMF1/EgtB/PvdO family nonheme iron enzyme [Kiritimatiellia bacterium]